MATDKRLAAVKMIAQAKGRLYDANFDRVILDATPVTFGNNVFIAPNCVFSTAGHPIDAPLRNEGLEYALPITVGDDVW